MGRYGRKSLIIVVCWKISWRHKMTSWHWIFSKLSSNFSLPHISLQWKFQVNSNIFGEFLWIHEFRQSFPKYLGISILNYRNLFNLLIRSPHSPKSMLSLDEKQHKVISYGHGNHMRRQIKVKWNFSALILGGGGHFCHNQKFPIYYGNDCLNSCMHRTSPKMLLLTWNSHWSEIWGRLKFEESLEKIQCHDVILWRHEIFQHTTIIRLFGLYRPIKYNSYHNFSKNVTIDSKFSLK